MRVGESVSIRKSGVVCEVVITALSDRRGNATAAALLYRETEASAAAREAAQLERRAAELAQPRFPGRPTKRERRKLEDFLNERAERLSTQLHVGKLEQEIRLAVGAKHQPGDGQRQQYAGRMPECAVRKEAARRGSRAVLRGLGVVAPVRHPASLRPLGQLGQHANQGNR